jgi:hypothetical protein
MFYYSTKTLLRNTVKSPLASLGSLGAFFFSLARSGGGEFALSVEGE